MNGRTRGDTRGEFTFRSSDNASTVDYFVASPQLLTMADTLTVHRDIVVSDHFPLELVFNLPCSTAAQRPPTHHSISKHIPRFKYDITAADAYRDKLQCLLSEHLDPEMDTQTYVTKLQNCITEAAADVYGLKVLSAEPKTATQPQNAWFDDECKHMRKQLGAALRSSGCDAAAKLLHKQYKNMLKKKKADFRHTSAQEFCDLVQKKPQKFWATFVQNVQATRQHYHQGRVVHIIQHPPQPRIFSTYTNNASICQHPNIWGAFPSQQWWARRPPR